MYMLKETISWSTEMADTVIERYPELYALRPYRGKWSYDYGVVLKGLEKVYKETNEQKYFDYIQKTMDYFIGEDGSIKDYEKEKFNIDFINNGKVLLFLYKETKQEKYKKAAERLRDQLADHPRTSEGAFWHKKIYPYQIWLDGLYMSSPFYLEYIKMFEDQDYSDVIKQFELCDEHTRSAVTQLRHHAWDEKAVQPWCDPETGLSRHYWSRSLGWYLMALADVIELLDEDSEDKEKLIWIFRDTLEGVIRYQDQSGTWYQIIDKGGRKPNYLESSGSCMFLYALAKGRRLGLLEEEKWFHSMEKAYEGILDEFVLTTKEGWLNLNKCCEVAGLGGADQRDGSFAYYMSEAVIMNDFKAVGAFIQAMNEYEKVTKSN
ncbi:glycoside hydrolase family 88 protein [Marinilactibacillus sp. XAAS-LB27]|uniref:glycoside hydrolase family 88/105 protein n=1 Tax=Marinilactibacillus sp. XAAS-LB27 TaxID=3114538 RepID=UPI002E18F6D0|nr:glycoside hydrolase family 88 protein [Marinilactibacillus sp. XAAS-LB27]